MACDFFDDRGSIVNSEFIIQLQLETDRRFGHIWFVRKPNIEISQRWMGFRFRVNVRLLLNVEKHYLAGPTIICDAFV